MITTRPRPRPRPPAGQSSVEQRGAASDTARRCVRPVTSCLQGLISQVRATLFAVPSRHRATAIGPAGTGQRRLPSPCPARCVLVLRAPDRAPSPSRPRSLPACRGRHLPGKLPVYGGRSSSVRQPARRRRGAPCQRARWRTVAQLSRFEKSAPGPSRTFFEHPARGCICYLTDWRLRENGDD